jgi:hypothetical protein
MTVKLKQHSPSKSFTLSSLADILWFPASKVLTNVDPQLQHLAHFINGKNLVAPLKN